MLFFRKNPFFCSLLLLLLVCCLVGLWFLIRLSGELSLLESSYQTKASQYDRYLSARPSPTRSNLEAIDDNYRELYLAFEKAMGNLNLNTFDRKSFYGDTPASRADWSFELHKFKENARYAALSNSIELPASVEFSFDDYATVAPPADEMAEVHQQIVIMSSLLDTLFDSGIQSFVKIQRGVKPKGNRSVTLSRRPANRLYGDGDRFVVGVGQSLSIPGTIDSYMFRLVFRGQSISLRKFLNSVAQSPLPFVIRGVEADLSSEGGEKDKLGQGSLADNPFSANSQRPVNQSAGVPIISDNTSLFVVTVEFLQLAVEIPEPSVAEQDERLNDA